MKSAARVAAMLGLPLVVACSESAPTAVPTADVSIADAGVDTAGHDTGSDAHAAADARTFEAGTPPACPTVQPTRVPAELGLDAFYERYLDSGGIPIVGSAAVPDAAFAQAHYVVANMLRDRPCLRAALVDSGIRVGILARDEVTTDLPEYRDFYDAFPGTDWDTRGRGFGATLIRPLTSGSVDNLLQDEGDPWRGENILLHELAHSVWEFGVASIAGGKQAEVRLARVYESARDAGLWDETYAATNSAEYWAEGVQSWFDNNIEQDPADGIHNAINTRVELQEYDPSLADLIASVFDPTPWPAHCANAGQGPAWHDPTPIASMEVECGLEARTLEDLGCDALPSAGSPPGERRAEVAFVNRTYDETYTFAWVDFSGSESAYGSVPPRSLSFQETFEGHSWVVRDSNGDCAGVYEPASDRARIFLD